LIKAVLGYLFAAAFFYLILAYVAGFSTGQSIVLALLVAWFARGIENAAAKPARRFSPYYVRVYPKWFEILNDFKLIKNPEEWHAIQNTFEELPSAEYRVLRNGVCFTVVHQSEDFERTLIYSDNWRTFFSEVDFEEEMRPIKIEEREQRLARLFEYYVRFLMKSGDKGYNLGIIVPDWWWDEVKASCPTPLEEDKDYPTGQVKLILATISFREFDLYWEPMERSISFYEKTAKQIRDRRDEQRKKLGWKAVEHPDLSELSIAWPDSIEHKYFNVEHRAI